MWTNFKFVKIHMYFSLWSTKNFLYEIIIWISVGKKNFAEGVSNITKKELKALDYVIWGVKVFFYIWPFHSSSLDLAGQAFSRMFELRITIFLCKILFLALFPIHRYVIRSFCEQICTLIRELLIIWVN